MAMRWCPPGEITTFGEGENVWLLLGEGKREWEEPLLSSVMDAVEDGTIARAVVEYRGSIHDRKQVCRLLEQAEILVLPVAAPDVDAIVYCGEPEGRERFCEAMADVGPVIVRERA